MLIARPTMSTSIVDDDTWRLFMAIVNAGRVEASSAPVDELRHLLSQRQEFRETFGAERGDTGLLACLGTQEVPCAFDRGRRDPEPHGTAQHVRDRQQSGGGDLPCRRRDRAQRPQETPGHEPTEPQRKRAHHGQCDARGDEQLSPVDAVLARRDQYAPGGRRQRHGGPVGPPEPHHDGDRQQQGACSEEGGEDHDGEPRSDGARGQVQAHGLA